MNILRSCWALMAVSCACSYSFAAEPQRVEGFDQVVFHYDEIRSAPQRDYLGMSRGYYTAAWWTSNAASNVVIWKTAAAPKKERTTFVFVGASSVVPTRFVRGPEAELYVDGEKALQFSIGWNKDVTWASGDYQLKYISKRVEYPFFGTQRQFYNEGNSGRYELTVPAAVVEAGRPVELKVHLLPFQGWSNGWFAVKEHRSVLKRTPESYQGEIEVLRADMNQMGLQLQALASRVYPELHESGRFHHEVLYSDGFTHLHPADLIRLSDGELLLFTRQATEHISRDGDVLMLRSRDGGRTWGDKQLIAAIPNVDEREACGLELKDGTIVAGVFYNNLYNQKGQYKVDLDKPTVSTNLHQLGAYVIRSKDRGRTWSEPAWIETTGMPFRNLEGPTDAPIELPDGTILMGLIGYGLHGDSKNVAAVMVQSKDQGKSWTYLSTMASDPGGKLGGFMEPGIVRTRSGRIVTALRNHGTEGAIWVTHSDDLGRTWAPVKKTALVGHPVDLLQLADGRLLATYGVRQGSHTTPGGIRACLSSDDGETWPLENEVELRSDLMNWDIGYPESIQMPEGQVLTVYYYNLFGRYFIGGTFWKP